MDSLNKLIKEYTIQLEKGKIQRAYKGIMTFVFGLKNYLQDKYKDYFVSKVYLGYMDITYFTFTFIELKNRNLKIALVYIHENNIFEIWLVGRNKNIQKEYLNLLSNRYIGKYKLSKNLPEVVSIIELRIIDNPNFNNTKDLMMKIEEELIKFNQDIFNILDNKNL